MIEGIFGLPGKGKTYEAVRRVLQRADAGGQCYSVTPINHPNVELITFQDVTDPYLPPGLIFLDEVHLVLPSSAHSKLDPDWYAKLSQTRKDGHDLIYTSQNESKVLKQLRDNTNYGWVCKALFKVGPPQKQHPLVFTAKCWEMHTLRKGRAIDSYWHYFNRRVAEAYQTRFAIREHAATVDRSDVRYVGVGNGIVR